MATTITASSSAEEDTTGEAIENTADTAAAEKAASTAAPAQAAPPTAGEGRACVLETRVKLREAWAFLGHRGQEIDEHLQERLEHVAALCERELAPRGIFRVFPLVKRTASTPAPAGVAVGGTSLVLPGSSIARHLRGCSEVALMAVTLGPRSEMFLRREAALGPTNGMLADACASSLVEQAAGALDEQVKAAAEMRGLKATWRFSPGYGDLPLSVQPAFLTALDASRALGITTTPAHMLVPAKSITAIVGFFDPSERAQTKGTEHGA